MFELRDHPARRLGRLAAGVAVAACLLAGCGSGSAPTSPTDLVVTLATQIDLVPAGGAAPLIARVSRSGGGPVPDGTIVRFTTTLGRVEPAEAVVVAGTALSSLVAGGATGPADVIAASGGASSAPLRFILGASVPAVSVAAVAVGGQGVVATADVQGADAVLFEWFFERGPSPEVVGTSNVARYTYPSIGFKDFTVRVTFADGRRALGSGAVIVE